MCNLPKVSATSTKSQKLRAFYDIDRVLNEEIEDIDAFTSEAQKESYLFEVWSGTVTIFSLDEGLYARTGKILEKAVDSVPGASNLSFYKEFKKSTWLFSGAKNFRTTLELNFLLRNEDGSIKTFNEFKKVAFPELDKFGKQYLKTEYNYAVSNTQNAIKWDQFQKDKEFLPSLKYVTVRDARVRDDHRALDGIIRPVDDPFWNTYAPENDWNCRCMLQQVRTKQKTDLRKKKIPKLSPIFQNNPGTSRKLFTQKHPYFDVPKELESFRRNNFGLPLPADLFIDG